MRGLLLGVAALALGPAGVLAQGIIVPGPCFRPLPRDPAPDERVVPVCPPTMPAVVRTRSIVHAELAGEGSARVIRYEVDERFVNRGGMLGEADYLFPLPKDAAFQDLKLSIDGELVAGETLGAAEARGIYENIVRRQRDPALVEWMGRGLLHARIFPIRPGEEKRVVVRYQMVVPREGDALRIDYGIGNRGSRMGDGGWGMGNRGSAVSSPDSRASSPDQFVLTYPASSTLGTPYSPTSILDVSGDEEQRRVAVRGDAGNVTILIPVRAPREPAISVLAQAPGSIGGPERENDGFALITLTPPMNATASTERLARDVTFVLDVSGSMSGRKMEQARAAGRQLLQTLRPQDRFRLIDFSTDVRAFDGYRVSGDGLRVPEDPSPDTRHPQPDNGFLPATQRNIHAAMDYLDQLEASGSTNIAGALDEALRAPEQDPEVRSGERLSLVLFVTDGEPTVGDRDPARIAALAARERGHSRVFTFGLGADVNAGLLEQLASEGRGTAQFVRPEESVERAVGIVASRLVDPVLTDVRITTDGDVRLSRMLPVAPLDLFAGQDLVRLARYSGHGWSRITFEGRHAGETVRWSSVVSFPEHEIDNPFVARLWATQRVGYLSMEKRKALGSGESSAEIDEEIRSLGERFGIPTEFTSYLVQEPGVVADGGWRGVAGGVAGRPAAPAPAPMAARAMNFEQAKVASEQRAATSIAAMDTMAAAGISGANAADANGAIRRAGTHTFVRRDGVWVDTRYHEGASAVRVVRIKPFSKAYFDLLQQLPELRDAFSLGDRVIVAGRNVAVRLDDSGKSELSGGEMREVVENWY